MDAALWRALRVQEAGLADLQRFADLVRKWNAAINLVARSTLPDLWARHVEDSARLCLHAPVVEHWADLGAGGGFPGIVAALVCKHQGVGTRFTLVESDQRKAAFLREAARQLELSVTVLAERAEILVPLSAGIVSARALSALSDLCALAERHLSPDGVALFLKGESWQTEVENAKANWRFELEAVTDPGHKGAILKLRSISRA